jgi:hypothetical protein
MLRRLVDQTRIIGPASTPWYCLFSALALTRFFQIPWFDYVVCDLRQVHIQSVAWAAMRYEDHICTAIWIDGKSPNHTGSAARHVA